MFFQGQRRSSLNTFSTINNVLNDIFIICITIVMSRISVTIVVVFFFIRRQLLLFIVFRQPGPINRN